MSIQNKSATVKMRPRARLISVIGNELISDEPVALVELVKNSYDADATRVQVEFRGDKDNYNSIVVADDGIGMGLDDVLHSWLEPGASSKRIKQVSGRGRTYQGAKGIGRFAAARLAEELFMETKEECSREGVSVLFEWGAFDEESYLDELDLTYEVTEFTDFSHGTRLTLDSLRRQWQEKDLEQLHSRLARLLSPFKEVTDFQIFLDVPGYPDLSGEISPPELIYQPLYLMKGKLDGDGFFSGELRIDKEVTPVKRVKLGTASETPVCGGFEVEIRAWDRETKDLLPFQERFGMTVRDIRGTLNKFSGVSIYRDGFRVYPYGEAGNDWLSLDIRSRQVPARNLANNQIIAAVKISRKDNPDLQDRSNREGLIKNDAYEELRTWFIEILKQLELARSKSKKPKVEPPPVKVQPLLKQLDIEDTVREVEQELGSAHKVSKLIADTSSRVKEGVDQIQQVFSRLLLSAGIGHLVDIVLHEIGSPVGKLGRQLKIMEKDLKKRCDEDTASHFAPMFESIYRWLEEIIELRKRLDPQSPGKRARASSFDVVEDIQDFIELYRTVVDKQKIDLKIQCSEKKLVVKMARSALDQILANLVDNAIYWIIRHNGSGNGGRIVISVDRMEHGFSIRISDDGPGVDEADLDDIFEPYFSKKPNGIGLGLYIGRLLIEPYGQLIYCRDSSLPGACFEARFETGVGL